jgi:hypothetical protein
MEEGAKLARKRFRLLQGQEMSPTGELRPATHIIAPLRPFSQRAIERLGAVREGALRQDWIMPNGRVRDSVLYSILLDEWPACKARLEKTLQTACRSCGGYPAHHWRDTWI